VAFDVAYSRLDRLFHKLAFAAPAVQLTAADIENGAFGSFIEDVPEQRPVFVTSLARAGTTIVLELLHQLPDFASHTYRDMPFVMAPVLWSKLSGAFRKPAVLKERAHGDGLDVGFDSPEAFEEVVWRTFWPDHYQADQISLLSADDDNSEAAAFLRTHMRKIVALRRPATKTTARYLSKNNANIARLDLITSIFPEAQILLILRDPLEHAASLHRQHRNFGALHREDPFVQRYMADIGHFEFGELHRPFAFPRLETLIAGQTSEEPDYWLAYWIAAFDHVRARRDAVTLVCYEDLCDGGVEAFIRLCSALGVKGGEAVVQAGAGLRPWVPRADADMFDPGLRDKARAIYDDLRRAAI
jgi:Sulfotransferase family